MRVVTIGRSRDNDVCIDDPYVGRHHCQIVQHDNGLFTIVDMNSTNGTYVNGRRVFGEVQLQPYDSVTIGHTTLPWGSYFSPKTESYALPIVLGSVGGVLLTILLTLLIFRHSSNKAFAFKGECPDAVVVNLVDEDGTQYSIEAIEGQVCVWFEEGVTNKTAKKSIKSSGGRIVAQIPENGYYLVKVPADKLNIFLNKIKKENFVEWAYPNMVSYPCVAKNYILDNFYPRIGEKDPTPHGEMVQFAMQECGSGSPLDTFNIGTKNGKGINTARKWHVPMSSTDNSAFALSAIASSSDTGPIIINMSFGSSLHKRNDTVSYYWDEATVEEQQDYQKRYLASMKSIILNVKQLKDRDYIIVKAAGNDGVKEFDAAIISYLRKNLKPDELEIMNKHFIIVTAGEESRSDYYSRIEKDYEAKYEKAVREKNQEQIIHYDTLWRNAKDYVHFVKTYSNEMGSGRFDPLVTKVDISDFKYKGKDRYGTSFAAPRAACILSSVANDMNLTGAEVLQYAREATLNSPDHSLTYESLKNTVIAHQQAKTQPSAPNPTSTQPTNPSVQSSQSIPASLVGTKWEMPQISKQPRKHLHRLEFINNHQVKIISLEDDGIDNPYDSYSPYDCYYKPENNRIIVKRRINPSLWQDFEELEYVNGCLYGWSYGEKFAYKKVDTEKLEPPEKQTSGMGSYDYSAIISFSENLFKNNNTGRINLPNGDVIMYQYVYECDIFPEYYMKFTLGNSCDITAKYKVILVKTLTDDKGYVGKDENGYIDMRISYFGFDPQSSSKMIVLIKKK